MGKHTCDAEWATKKKGLSAQGHWRCDRKRVRPPRDAKFMSPLPNRKDVWNKWISWKGSLAHPSTQQFIPWKKNQSLQLFKYKKMNFCSRNAIFNWYTLGCKIIACVSQHARLCSLRNKHVRPNFIIRILMIHSNARHCFVVANSKWHYFIHWHFFGSKRSRIEKPFDFAFRVWTTINCLINWNIIYLYLLFFDKKTNLKLKKMIFVLSFNQK